MKIHAAKLLQPSMGKEWEQMPSDPTNGQLAFVSDELYICIVPGAQATWAKLSVDSLDEINDVDLTGIGDGYVLAYDLGSQTFKAVEQSTGDFLPLSGGMMEGDILPDVPSTRSIGSSASPFYAVHAEHGYFGANSLYINGKKVISDDSDQIYISTDDNQDLITKTTGGGDIRQEAGNMFSVMGPGGISLDVPSGYLNKDVSITNSAVSGDIDISTGGGGSAAVSAYGAAVQLFSDEEIDIQAPVVYMVGEVYVNGKLVGNTDVAVYDGETQLATNLSELRFGDSLQVTMIDATKARIDCTASASVDELTDVTISGSVAAGDVLYNDGSAWTNKALASILVSDLPALIARRTSSHVASTWEAMTFDAIDNQVGTEVSTPDGGTSFTFSAAGTYLVSVRTAVYPGSTQYSYLKLMLNGFDVPGSQSSVYTYRNEIHELTTQALITVAAGDSLSVYDGSQYSVTFTEGATVVLAKLTGIKGEQGERGEPGAPGGGSVAVMEDGTTIIPEVTTLDFGTGITATDGGNGVASISVQTQTGAATHEIIQAYDSSGNLNINTSSPTAVPFASETAKDTAFSHTSSLPTRIRVMKSGTYKFSYNITYMGDNSRKTIKCFLRKNSWQEVIPSATYAYTRNTTDGRASCTATVFVALTSGDYLEVMGQKHGSNGTAMTVANECWINAELVKEA